MSVLIEADGGDGDGNNAAVGSVWFPLSELQRLAAEWINNRSMHSHSYQLACIFHFRRQKLYQWRVGRAALQRRQNIDAFLSLSLFVSLSLFLFLSFFYFTKEIKPTVTRGSQSRCCWMKERNGWGGGGRGMENVFKMSKVRYSRFAYHAGHSTVYPFSLKQRSLPVKQKPNVKNGFFHVIFYSFHWKVVAVRREGREKRV